MLIVNCRLFILIVCLELAEGLALAVQRLHVAPVQRQRLVAVRQGVLGPLQLEPHLGNIVNLGCSHPGVNVYTA